MFRQCSKILILIFLPFIFTGAYYPFGFWKPHCKNTTKTFYDADFNEETGNYVGFHQYAVTVPYGCTHALVKMWGAGGQNGDSTNNGGGAAYATANLPVFPNETLTLFAAGGFSEGSGGGGAASGIKRGSTTLIVAGGGGGGGNSGGISDPGSGGAGGGTTGLIGSSGTGCTGGTGGTQISGGAKGTPDGDGDNPPGDGGHGPGGNGASCSGGQSQGWCFAGTGACIGSCQGASGSGGGGWYGGGGGGWFIDEGDTAGGGGGSSYDSTGSGTLTSGSFSTPGNNSDPDRGVFGQGAGPSADPAAQGGRIVLTFGD